MKKKHSHSGMSGLSRKRKESSRRIGEVHHLQNVLSNPWSLSNLWGILMALIGTIDFVLYCWALHECRLEEKDTDHIESSVMQTALGKYLFVWKKSDIPEESKNFDPSIYSDRISSMFCVLWVLEALRQSHLIDTWKWRKKLDKTSISETTVSHMKYVLASKKFTSIGVFCLYILLLPPNFFGIADSSKATWSGLILNQIKIFIVDMAKKLAQELTKRLAVFAFYHPALFAAHLAKAMNILRWIQYVLPPILSLNNVLQNFKKFLIKYRQYRDAQKIRKIKKILWGRLTKKERLETAAIRIQRQFRGWKGKQKTKVLVREAEEAAKIIQKSFRRRLERARSNIFERSMKLQRLQKIPAKLMSEEERAMERELENYLVEELQSKREMLMILRPNCLFCSLWKGLVFIIILMDMAQKHYGKKLHDVLDPSTGLPYTVESYLQASFLPEPFAMRSICRHEDLRKDSTNLIGALLKRFRGKAVVPDVTDSPWYCHGISANAQIFYNLILSYVIEKSLLSISVVLLIDAFITCFIGEFNSDGILVPKAFVQRWILGLALKLLLHPLSKPMATFLLVQVHTAGPTRVIRWYLSFVNPLRRSLLLKLWMCFVQWN